MHVETEQHTDVTETVGGGEPALGQAAVPDQPAAPDRAAFRDQWRDLQLRFVDDPRAAADGARDLVGRLVDELMDALAARKAEIDEWDNAGDPDTERMRVAMHRYRGLLHHLVDLLPAMERDDGWPATEREAADDSALAMTPRD